MVSHRSNHTKFKVFGLESFGVTFANVDGRCIQGDHLRLPCTKGMLLLLPHTAAGRKGVDVCWVFDQASDPSTLLVPDNLKVSQQETRNSGFTCLRSRDLDASGSGER